MNLELIRLAEEVDVGKKEGGFGLSNGWLVVVLIENQKIGRNRHFKESIGN